MNAEKKETTNELIITISEKLGLGQEAPKSLQKAVAKAAKELVDKVTKALKKQAEQQKAAILKEIKKQEKATKKAKLNLAVEVALKKVAAPAAKAAKE